MHRSHVIRHLLACLVCLIAGSYSASLHAAARAESTGDNANDKSFVIVLDAGHGGNDAGAVGAYSKEKNINLKVTLAVGQLLKANCKDVKVVYTRSTDVFIPLQTRADIANRNKADLFVSIHTNALPKGRIAYGSETYTLGMARAAANLEVAKRENSVITYEKNYQQTYEGFDPNKAESYIIFELMQDQYMKQSVELARCVQQQYVSSGRKNKGVHQAGFLVLRKTSMPAILTELGFISTPEEEDYLNSEAGVNALARSIYNGIVKYRNATATISSPILKDDPIDRGDPDERVTPQVASVATPSKSKREDKSATETPDEPARQTKSESSRQAENQEAKSTEAKVDENRPVFRVQLFVVDRVLKSTDKRLKGLSPVDYYRDNGSVKYTYGESNSYAEIRRIQKSIASKFPDTFIVAFIDGKRTDLNKAIKLARTQK